MNQLTVRCVLMRGGTSKGLYFHERDLPAPGPRRDALLLRLMGSPDVLQIDGLGGSRPITSKVAVIAPSDRTDADVEYTFAQVEVDGDRVHHAGNCGNISSGVGPFAVDEGLVAVTEPVTRVRIHNTNTDAIIVADVPVADGAAEVDGDFAIAGVPGTGAEIAMNWKGTVGAKTGALLPSGNAADTLTLDDGTVVRATLCDAANPFVWVRAGDVGVDEDGTAADVTGDDALMRRLAEVREHAAVAMGLSPDRAAYRRAPSDLPLVAVVAPPHGYTSLHGRSVRAADMDLRVHVIFMGRLHESVPGTGSVCLAAASRVPGSVVHDVTRDPSADRLLIGHPSGVTPARAVARPTDAHPYVVFDDLGFSRTARRLMDCQAYYPRRTLE